MSGQLTGIRSTELEFQVNSDVVTCIMYDHMQQHAFKVTTRR